MCISCHFWDCQVLLGSSLIHVRSTVVWVSDLYLYFLKTGSMNKLHLSHITTSIKACIDTTVAVHTSSENVRCFATSSSLSPARLYPIAIRDSSTTKINVWTRRSTIETPRRQSFNRTLDQLIGSALQRWKSPDEHCRLQSRAASRRGGKHVSYCRDDSIISISTFVCSQSECSVSDILCRKVYSQLNGRRRKNKKLN